MFYLREQKNLRVILEKLSNNKDRVHFIAFLIHSLI